MDAIYARLTAVNRLRKAAGLKTWVIDDSACQPGYYALMYGGAGYVETRVVLQAMNVMELLIFLRGAIFSHKNG